MVNETRVLVTRATDQNATLAEQHEAFAALVRAFQDMAYASAYAVLGDFQLAEDAAQDAFISAWQKLYQLNQPEAFPGWFRRIVLTECSRRRRRGKRLQAERLEDNEPIASSLADPQTALETDALRRAVFAAIMELPENERSVVTLFYLREHSQRDIGAFLELPVTTVAKRLYSARARLRGKMTRKFKEEFIAHRPSRSRTFEEKVAAGIFDEYVGEYKYEKRPDLTVTIKREGSKLISESAGQTNELFAAGDSETELHVREFDGRGLFVRNKKGRVTHFVYYEFGTEMGSAKKVA
jgi:RNA polymerase sigma factor (sigma-70 family)